jgi:hypothetical protein
MLFYFISEMELCTYFPKEDICVHIWMIHNSGSNSLTRLDNRWSLRLWKKGGVSKTYLYVYT